MEWTLFADLADVAGDRTVAVSVDNPDPTVGDALEALLADRPDLAGRVLDDDGDLHEHVNVLVDGAEVRADEGLDAPVDADADLALLPPVSGG